MATPENAPENQKQVSDVAAFKKRAQANAHGEVLELPSGLSVKVRRPSVTALIKTGHIPADVAAAMQNVAPGKQLQGNDMKKYLELLDLIVLNSVVEPKVVASGQQADDAISVDDLDDLDKQFVMQYVQSGVTDLTPFRTVASS
jgi:hypothetical protein